jgi:methyl-accepting chemotaxis protein
MKTTSEGVDLAGEAERAFGRIIETIEETTLAAKQISLATQQQHTGTEQIVSAMGEVSEVAQTWVKGIGDTTQSVGELSSIAQQFKSLVSKYRTVQE